MKKISLLFVLILLFTSCNYGSQLTESGGENNEPPLLMNLLIENWGPYDSSTGVSGDFEFRSDIEAIFFNEYGRLYAVGTPDESANPTFEYKVPRDTFVYIPIDGVVSRINWQPTSGYKQDDWEIFIKPSMQSDWMIIIDHVVSINCDRSSTKICDLPLTINGVEVTTGMEVKAGDLFGYVGNSEDNSGGNVFGRTEITIGKYIKDRNQVVGTISYCPMSYLHPSVKQNLESSINNIMDSYETWLGNSSFYDEANMVAPGCVYSQITESNGKTTPTK